MFCPNCSNHNLDNARFCRACGADLEAMALVYNNRVTPPSAWLEKYGESKSKVATGAIIGGGALLIWFVPALLIHDIMGWTAIWSVFFGWMAVWGFIKMAVNVGGLVKAKTMINATTTNDRELSSGEKQVGLPQTPLNYPIPNSNYDTDQLKSPPSVTEHTTKFLNKQ